MGNEEEIPVKFDNSQNEQIETLKQQNLSLCSKIKTLETKYAKWESDIASYAEEVQKKYLVLEQKYKEAIVTIEQAQEEILSLRGELSSKSAVAFELEIELKQLRKQVEETYEPYKKCALDVVQNLPMWEQNYNRACDNAKTVAELTELIDEREETISLLQSKIAADTEKMRY